MFEVLSNFGLALSSILTARFGHGSKDVIEIVDTFFVLLGEGEDVKPELMALVERIQEMQATGVGLSGPEIAAYRERRQALSGEISAIREGREIELIQASENRDDLAKIVGDPDQAQEVRDAAEARLDELGPAE